MPVSSPANRAAWHTADGVNAFGGGTLTNAAGGTVRVFASVGDYAPSTTYTSLGGETQPHHGKLDMT